MSFKITKYNSLIFNYKNHSYEVYKPKSKGQNLKALNKLFHLVESMLSLYSKVCVIRIDLHPNEFSTNNQTFCQFIKQQQKKLSKQYGCTVGYTVTREQLTSSKHHYHLALMLSGHKISHSQKLLNELKQAWEQQQLGTAQLVKHPFYTMKRGDKNTIDPVIYRLSYLTKEHSKELNGKARSFIFSKMNTNSLPEIDDTLLVDSDITAKNNQLRQIEHNRIQVKIDSYQSLNQLISTSSKSVVEAGGGNTITVDYWSIPKSDSYSAATIVNLEIDHFIKQQPMHREVIT